MAQWVRSLSQGSACKLGPKSHNFLLEELYTLSIALSTLCIIGLLCHTTFLVTSCCVKLPLLCSDTNLIGCSWVEETVVVVLSFFALERRLPLDWSYRRSVSPR